MKPVVAVTLLLVTYSAYGQHTDAMAATRGSRGSTACSKVGHDQAECSFSRNDVLENAETGHALAITSYGPLRLFSAAEIKAYVAGEKLESLSRAIVWSYDVLSVNDLSTPAFVQVDASVSFRPNGMDKLGFVHYVVYVGDGNCDIMKETIPPACTFKTRVKPGETIRLERMAAAVASVRLPNFPSGTNEASSVAIGYPPDTGSGATLKISVVDAEGHLIDGVHVVGSSGYVYAQQ